MALYFQIRDDFINLNSSKYMLTKSFCEDITEGKFSFPIIHSIRTRPKDHRLLNILKQKTDNVEVKQHAVNYMRETVLYFIPKFNDYSTMWHIQLQALSSIINIKCIFLNHKFLNLDM